MIYDIILLLRTFLFYFFFFFRFDRKIRILYVYIQLVQPEWQRSFFAVQSFVRIFPSVIYAILVRRLRTGIYPTTKGNDSFYHSCRSSVTNCLLITKDIIIICISPFKLNCVIVSKLFNDTARGLMI